MENSNKATDFENILQRNSRKTPLLLYNASVNRTVSSCNAVQIISNVKDEIKMLQSADRNETKNVRSTVNKLPKTQFAPLCMINKNIQDLLQIPVNQNRFETQCVTDTQLLDVIENAEAVHHTNEDITNEFNSTFDTDLQINHKDILDETIDEFKENSISPLEKNNISTHKEKVENIKTTDQSFKIIDNNDVYDEFTNKNQNLNESQISCRPTSPVLNVKSSKRKSTNISPLVYDLEEFEKFEKIALPIIKKNNDLETVKQLINSQIIGKELETNIDMDIHLDLNNIPLSPVLKSAANQTKVKVQEENDKITLLKDLDIFCLDKGSDILKEEILFSSNEENSIITKQSYDLPLTCALETSFYSEADILDATMLVAFQTASNKCIQICTDSFYKAKQVYENVSKESSSDFNLNKSVNTDFEEVQNFDPMTIENTNKIFGSKNLEEKLDIISYKASGQSKDISEDDFRNLNYLDNKIIQSNKEPIQEKHEFQGFKTASNKVIQLSEKALVRCKRVFQDIDLNEKFNDEEIDCIKSRKAQFKPSQVAPLIQKIVTNSMTEKFENNDVKNNIKSFGGFKTASNKNINISNSALTKFKDIVKDIDLNEKLNEAETEKIDFSKSKFEQEDNFVGFKTASNKKIGISKKAYTETKHVFEDIEMDVITNPASIDNELSDNRFTTSNMNKKALNIYKTKVNTKKVNISKEAIEKSKSVFQDIDNNYDNAKNNSCLGFKTANNKPVMVNAEKLDEAKGFSKDLNDEYLVGDSKISPKNAFLGFQTANNKQIDVSKEALLKAKELFKENDENMKCDNITNIEPVFLGFKTGNTEVMSDEVLPRTIDFFKDIDENFNKMEHNDIFEGFKTASNKNIKISTEALAKSKKLLDEVEVNDNQNIVLSKEDLIEIPPKNTFVGFQTANNKQIDVSKEALLKAKELFKENDENMKCDKIADIEPVFLGFKTGNTEVMSDENLPKTIDFFKDIDENFDKMEHNVIFEGFKTASNKNIKISSEALAKSKKLLDKVEVNDNQNIVLSKEDLIEIPPKNTFVGFQTANNKQIDVSKEALLKAKELFKEKDENMKCDKIADIEPVFLGFKTGNTEVMSDEDLPKTIDFFKDIDENFDKMEHNVIFEGFKTATNKNIKISSEALAKSKKLLDEVGVNDNSKILLSKEDLNERPKFPGFQTSSKKPVKISAQALTQSKQLFKNIKEITTPHTTNVQADTDIIKVNKVDDITENYKLFVGFQTANKTKISVTKEASAKTKGLFDDIELPNEITKFRSTHNNVIKIRNEQYYLQNKDGNNEKVKDLKIDNIENIIDTQGINNFEFTLNAKNFSNEATPNVKRASSPILSCPRAKKRKKFETPFKSDLRENGCKNNDPIPNQQIKDNSCSLQFDNKYKKYKKYTLKDLTSMEKKCYSKRNVDPYILSFNFDSLLQFVFTGKRNEFSNKGLSIDMLKTFFLNYVNEKIVPDGWLDNHIKLILWKLISYEIKYTHIMDIVCTAKNVIDQLKYRYDRELYNVERPALRKILEKDDVASKLLVLCVVGVYVEGIRVNSVTNLTNKIELLLTDGWYCIRACLDPMLSKLVYDNKIVMGTKIVTHGAELVNCEQGLSPWEDTSSVRLKIFGNSTRRARYDARLGYHGNAALLTHLSSVKLDGGKVSKIRVFVSRVYPSLYVEKFEDGSTVTRSERLEHIHQTKYETERQILMEKIYEEVEKEYLEEECQDSASSLDSDTKRKGAKCQSKMYNLGKLKDSSDMQSQLTTSQLHQLQKHAEQQKERTIRELESRFQDKLASAGLNARNVVTLLKIRIVGVHEKNGTVEITKGVLSIWRPNDAILEVIKEGSWIEVLNVVPTSLRYSEIQLSAGRQSVFSQSKYNENGALTPHIKSLQRTCHRIEDLVKYPMKTTDYNEIDTVGMICHIEPSIKEFDTSKNQQFQNVYFTDGNKNLICVNFWGGMAKFGYQNILDTGQIFACINLQKRVGNTRKKIPQFRVTEFSYFTKTPKYEKAREFVELLSKKFSTIDRRKYFEECVVLKNNYTSTKNFCSENISPYRFNNDHNISKNKIFIDSSLPNNNIREDIFNLTGLDFESTFKQDSQDISPKLLIRKKQINEKIARLKMYGEPPPLCPIKIINKSANAKSAFKNPLSNSDVSPSVANTKNKLPITIGTNDDAKTPKSSSSLNQTYVKSQSIIPVKLNFSKAIDCEDDNFCEEFDGSPPLSFDSSDCK